MMPTSLMGEWGLNRGANTATDLTEDWETCSCANRQHGISDLCCAPYVQLHIVVYGVRCEYALT